MDQRQITKLGVGGDQDGSKRIKVDQRGSLGSGWV